MLINVKVVPQSGREELKEEDSSFKVWLKGPAEEGRANAALIKVLSKHFGVPAERVKIIRGLKGRKKVLKILTCLVL